MWSFRLGGELLGTCFGHVFSKACQYAINDEKVCKYFKYVFIKFTQIDSQKCIIWLNQFCKVRMKQGFHWSWFKAKKIEHSSENYINFIFKDYDFCFCLCKFFCLWKL
jgi:hypothetical protein